MSMNFCFSWYSYPDMLEDKVSVFFLAIAIYTSQNCGMARSMEHTCACSTGGGGARTPGRLMSLAPARHIAAPAEPACPAAAPMRSDAAVAGRLRLRLHACCGCVTTAALALGLPTRGGGRLAASRSRPGTMAAQPLVRRPACGPGGRVHTARG